MKRKVSKIGPATLMVSLPSSWVKQFHIQKGQELDVIIDEKRISFAVEFKKLPKEVTLPIDGFTKYMLCRYLEVCYIVGYDKIILQYSKPMVLDNKAQQDIPVKKLIKDLCSRFIGMEIIAQTKISSTIGCFLPEKEQNLKTIEKRVYFLFKEAFEEFLNNLGDHRSYHNEVYHHHDTIAKFITYYLRVLEQSDKPETEKRFFFSLYMIVDKMVDKFRHLSEKIMEVGITPKVTAVLKEIFTLVYEQFTALHTGKLSPELVTRRYALWNKLWKEKYDLKERLVLEQVEVFLETLNDFSRAIISSQLVQKCSG